jgi:hypothetical protein
MGGAVKAVSDAVSNVSKTVGLKDPLDDLSEGARNVVNTGKDAVTNVSKKLGLKDPLDDFGEGVINVLDTVADSVKDLGDDIGTALDNPYLQTAVSIWNPAYGAILRTASKIKTGQPITASELIDLGFSTYGEFVGALKNPELLKAASTAGRIADGADPVQSLVGAYGADFVKELDLAPKLNKAISGTFGEGAGNFITENMDLDQAAADLIAGENPSRIIANQFGDEVAEYIGSGNQNLEALGYAGIKTGVLLDEGVDPATAIYRGANEYYDRGGQLPDFNKIVDLSGKDISLPDIGINYQDFFSEIGKDIQDLVPEFGFGGLRDLGFDFGKVDLSGFDFDTELLPEFGFEGLADSNFNFGEVDLSGYDFGDFGGRTLPEIQDLGIDLGDIDLSNIQLSLGVLGALESEGRNPPGIVDEEEDPIFGPRTTDNPLLDDNDPLLSRAVLERTL